MVKWVHRSLALVLALVLSFAVMGSAQAVGIEARSKPYPNTTFTVRNITRTYPLTVKPSEPCVQIWAKNTDSRGNLLVRLVDENGKQMGSTKDLTPGESGIFQAVFTGSSAAKWQIEVIKRSDDIAEVTGMFSAKTGTEEAKTQTSMDLDPYEHATLGTQPYPFKTTEDYPYFCLWIRNNGDTEIMGTITYANTEQPKRFTVPAADPKVGYSDYITAVIEPGAGKHEIKLRADGNGALKGELSLHVDSWHFQTTPTEGFGNNDKGDTKLYAGKEEHTEQFKAHSRYVEVRVQNDGPSDLLCWVTDDQGILCVAQTKVTSGREEKTLAFEKADGYTGKYTLHYQAASGSTDKAAGWWSVRSTAQQPARFLNDDFPFDGESLNGGDLFAFSTTAERPYYRIGIHNTSDLEMFMQVFTVKDGVESKIYSTTIAPGKWNPPMCKYAPDTEFHIRLSMTYGAAAAGTIKVRLSAEEMLDTGAVAVPK